MMRARKISDETALDPRLDEHFLANRTLSVRRAASMLLSSSFGANAVLYAAFLGYVMGLWALIIQVAWTLSFFLLMRYSSIIYESTSLHEFLGRQHGQLTRRLAALCSIIGIVYFAGWEIAVARTSLASIISTSYSSHIASANALSAALIIIMASVATVYTVTWGRKANGKVNLVANGIKILALLAITGALAYSVLSRQLLTATQAFPTFSAALAGIGLIGLITNLVLNLDWQFIDNTSWQSISSAADKDKSVKNTISWAGIITLLTVNGLGTLLGVLLRFDNSITSDNILGSIVQSSTFMHAMSLIAMIVLLVFAAMTLIDGAMLSISQTITVDFRSQRVGGTFVRLQYARIVTVIVSLFIAFGVNTIVRSFGGSIFDFVYIFIIAQLCLTGPVLAALFWPKRKTKAMWLSLLLGLAAGFGAAIIGTLSGNQDLVQAAGTIAAGISVVCAFSLVWLLPATQKSSTPE